MTELSLSLNPLLRDMLWQTTAIFAVALLAARLVVRRPARVHSVLALAFLAAIAAPLTSHMVRRAGWGLLPPGRAIVSTKYSVASRGHVPPAATAKASEQQPITDDPARVQQAPLWERELSRDRTGRAAHAATQTALAAPQPAAARSALRWPVLGRALGITALGLWLVASGWLLARLLRGVIAGRRLMAAATPCAEPAVAAALAAARQQLALEHLEIDILASSAVRCPMIWCWASRPRLLLPVHSAQQWPAGTWTPILCHELAHWKRRDHWAALVAETICCAMPWQVLGWWAKRRLEHASEQACDDWTIATGHSAIDYAETLLGLVAQADPPLALAALRRRSGLGARIQHILAQAVARPRLGRAWGAAVLALTVLGVGAAAVCQRGLARADAPQVAGKPAPAAKPKANTPAAGNRAAPNIGTAMPARTTGTFMPGKAAVPGGFTNPQDTNANASEKPQRHKVSGTVLSAEGQPIAGAELWWEVRYRPANPNRDKWPGPIQIASTKTDASGQFAIEAALAKKNLAYSGVAIRADGHGLRGYTLDPLKTEETAEVRMEPAQPIEGQVFTPNGEPVKGARVAVDGLSRIPVDKEHPGEHESWHLMLHDSDDDEIPSRVYCPAPVITDGEGRFRIDNCLSSKSVAELVVDAPEFARTRVRVAMADAPRWDDRPIREPNFSLVLAQPYLVDARFTDETTGKGVAGVRVDSMPMSNRYGGNRDDTVTATTDAEGRYQVHLGVADIHSVRVFPPTGYPGISNSFSAAELERIAAGTRTLKFDIKLKPGVVVRGRVVDEKSQQGVAGASVEYYLTSGRRFGINSNFEPVKTDADGNFEVTAADGVGFLLVDAPDQGFYRIAAADKRLPQSRGPLHPHGLLEIDVPKADTKEPYLIGLKRGPALVIRALDPSGNPVKYLQAACVEGEMEQFFSARPWQNATYELDAVEPGRKYRVFLYSSDANAGKVAELEANADGSPVDVKLEPCATIRGRYVYEEGVPVPEVTNFSHFRTDPEQGIEPSDRIYDLPFYDNFVQHQSEKRTTDADGNFVLDDIVPGVFMYLSVNYRYDDNKNYRVVGMLAPGEVKDLGNITIRPRQ
ncbi:MAG: M56 family metallopeptidase [Pirellulales bacterium]